MSMQNSDVVVIESDDSILERVLQLRLRVADDIVKTYTDDKTGALVLDDPTQNKLFKDMLDGAERQILTKKRLRVDEGANKANEELASAVAELLYALPSNRHASTPPDPNRVIPSLGADVPTPTLVEGESAVSAPQDDYVSFMQRQPERVTNQ